MKSNFFAEQTKTKKKCDKKVPHNKHNKNSMKGRMKQPIINVIIPMAFILNFCRSSPTTTSSIDGVRKRTSFISRPDRNSFAFGFRTTSTSTSSIRTTKRHHEQHDIIGYSPTSCLFGRYAIINAAKEQYVPRRKYSFTYKYHLSSSTLYNQYNNNNISEDGTNTTPTTTTTTSTKTSSQHNNQYRKQQQQQQQQHQQQNYSIQMKDFKGVTKSYTSSSEFVSHFISNQNNTFTIAQAIESVLPKPVPEFRIHSNAMRRFVLDDVMNDVNNNSNNSDDDGSDENKIKIQMSEWNNKLIQYEEQNPILQSMEAKFRHDPSLLGDTTINNNKDEDNNNDEQEKDQLSPAELVALGSVWFLPHDAPRDPSQGRKVRIQKNPLLENKKRCNKKKNTDSYHLIILFCILYTCFMTLYISLFELNF